MAVVDKQKWTGNAHQASTLHKISIIQETLRVGETVFSEEEH